jgi:hypothetical protein
MSHSGDEFEGLVGALREELPTSRDQQRVRAQLETAGALVAGSTLLAARVSEGLSAEAGLASLGPKVGALGKLGTLGKLAALGSGPKLVVVASIASAVALPVAWHTVSKSKATETSLTTSSAVPVPTAPLNNRVSDPTRERATLRDTLDPNAKAPPGGTEPTAPEAPRKMKTPEASASESSSTQSSSNPDPSRSPNPTASSAASPLREETALMELALAALRRGDRAAARAFLAQHGARFPNGALALERERTLARLATSPSP